MAKHVTDIISALAILNLLKKRGSKRLIITIRRSIMQFETYDYKIGTWALPAIINGDYSGLGDDEDVRTYPYGN